MQAIRQIVDIKKHSLHIVLPDDFDSEKAEVIILPFYEAQSKNNKEMLRGKLNLTPDQYSDFQQHVKDGRNEWNQTI